VCTTCVWNNLRRVHLRSIDWKTEECKCFWEEDIQTALTGQPKSAMVTSAWEIGLSLNNRIAYVDHIICRIKSLNLCRGDLKTQYLQSLVPIDPVMSRGRTRGEAYPAWVRARLCTLQNRCTRLVAEVITFTNCSPMVGGSIRVLRLPPPLKLIAMI
jgi:hypothetical protein